MHRATTGLTLALAAGVSFSAASSVLASCAAPSEAEVTELFGKWASALETVHPDRVLRLYAPDAILLPLAAHGARKGAAEIRDYYVYFLQREPKVAVEARTVRVDCTMVTDAGIYEMKARTRAGKAETFRVRYSLTWQKQERGWLIVHEHASIGPDKGTPDRSVIAPADPLAPAEAAVKPTAKPAVAGFVRRATRPTAARGDRQRSDSARPEPPAVRHDVGYDAR